MSILTDSPAATIPAGTWSIDPAWSSLEFEVKKLGLITIKGRVPGVSGAIRGGESPAVEGIADVSTITTFDETRDMHLQSPEFFDVARHPELRFASTSIAVENGRLVVDGELTVKGITRPVRLVGRFAGAGADPWGNERVGLELEGTVDRTEFGLAWNAPLPGGGLLLPDDVVLRATLAAIREA
jgi:polyisoprenoid-binding protein YceI